MIVEVPSDAPRLSLRWVHDGVARDVVGHLVAANDEWLVLLPEDRPAVWVPRAEADPPRVVPERLVLPTSRPEDLERALERARPATRRARLGGWRLSDHSVLALGDPGPPLARAVAEVGQWRAGPPVFRAVEGSGADALMALGYRAHGVTLILTTEARTAPLPRSVALTRGWALEVGADDVDTLEDAAAAGFAERYRAVRLVRP